jgi:hypothetical protein
MTTAQPAGMRALTREIADTSSPVRQFLNDRFTSGLPDVQRRFRSPAPPQPGAPAARRPRSPAPPQPGAPAARRPRWSCRP